MNNNRKKLQVAIFSPYLGIFGGGERYLLSIASALSKKADVFIYSDKDIAQKALSIFGISLKGVHFLPESFIRSQNILKRFISFRKYDLFFYMTDGSLFFSAAQQNFLIIQSPLHIPKLTLVNSLKLSNWHILCYSQYMKNIIEKKLGTAIKISILSPCIDLSINRYEPEQKENIILSVGRFFQHPHDKKHDMLIDLFKAHYKNLFSGWRLIIAGGLTEEGGKSILADLEEKSKGLPVEILVNLPSAKLVELYQKAKIYWHAAGFGEDLNLYPERAEHFGIAPLEAMMSNVVPLLYNAGGLRDIVGGQDDYLWNTREELTEKTVRLIQNDKLLSRLSEEAHEKALFFSCDKFYEKIDKVISG